MPKARKKKNSSFQTTITKSVFLYGRPNKEKLVTLQQMQNSYTVLVKLFCNTLFDKYLLVTSLHWC